MQLSVAAILLGLWACGNDGATHGPDAVGAAEWELQFLPAIDEHMKVGRLDSVIIVCQLGLEGDSTRILLYNLMASAYASQGRYGLATEALQTAVRLVPDYTVGWVNLGGIHTKLGKYDEAIPYLQRAAELDSNHSAVRRRLGEIYLNTGRYDEAAAEILAAMAFLPHDATLTFYLGKALEGLRQTEGALAAFLRSGELDPGYAEAQYRAASVARQLGRTTLADSCLAIHTHLMQIGDGATEVLDTREQLRGTIANAPEEAVNHTRLGGFYLHYGYLPEALALFHRAVILEPTNAWLMNEFGGLLSRTGNGPEALGFYQRALRADPDFGPALINTGGILNAMGRSEEALPHFERALVLNPSDPGIRFFLGVACLSLKRPEEARKHLDQALTEVGDTNDGLKQKIQAALESLSG